MAPVSIAKPDGGSLLIFEPPEQYARENALVGYWGPVTSSIDWCERNYLFTPFIAEFFNTISNLGMVLLGMLGMYLNWREGVGARYVVANFTLFIIGVGSAAFHGTLTHVGQQGDETPMIIGSAVWLWCLAFSEPAFEQANARLKTTSAVFGTVAVSAFAVLHYMYSFVLVFQGLVAVMIIVMLTRLYLLWRRANMPSLRTPYKLYMGTILVAFPLWLIDQHVCVHLHDLPHGVPNPQFHAWWHVLMGVNCYMGPVVESPIRLGKLGRKGVEIGWWGGWLPFVRVAGRRIGGSGRGK